jgi:hypothetical protein
MSLVRGVVVAVVLAATGCGGSSDASPCVTLCKKANSCRAAMGSSPLNCEACTYGGDLLPGLAPAPTCPDLAGQKACIEAAVQMSCDDAQYFRAAAACPSCSVLDGSGCASDGDCQKYQRDYRCDLGRPGGYCTRACLFADSDCSAIGPEVCTTRPRPSFDPQAPPTRMWCFLGCTSDAECRTGEGYACVGKGATGLGVCDRP